MQAAQAQARGRGCSASAGGWSWAMRGVTTATPPFRLSPRPRALAASRVGRRDVVRPPQVRSCRGVCACRFVYCSPALSWNHPRIPREFVANDLCLFGKRKKENRQLNGRTARARWRKILFGPVLVPVRASPVPSVARGSFGALREFCSKSFCNKKASIRPMCTPHHSRATPLPQAVRNRGIAHGGW